MAAACNSPPQCCSEVYVLDMGWTPLSLIPTTGGATRPGPYADSLPHLCHIQGGGGGQVGLLERGAGGGEGVQGTGGGGPRGRGSPPRVGTYLVHREQKIYWATNHSAHGNVILLVANKANSSLQVNSGFPHLIKTQQIQQSGTFTLSCQLTVIMVNQN